MGNRKLYISLTLCEAACVSDKALHTQFTKRKPLA